MRYRIGISEKARDQLRALPRETRWNIGQRLEAMREDLRGDVLKLKAKGNRYRLRVGTYRSLRSGGRRHSSLRCKGSQGSL